MVKTKKEVAEVSRKSRVKMHKSGKHWVRTVMSQIDMIRLGDSGKPTIGKVAIEKSAGQTSATTMLRGLIAASAAIGGGIAVSPVLAEDIATVSETTTTILATEDVVSMSNVGTESDTSSQSISDSASTSLSDSTSISDSGSLSNSASLSDSASLSASAIESISESESTSESESVSVNESHSTSESASVSESHSTSESASVSESHSISESASISESTSTSESASVSDSTSTSKSASSSKTTSSSESQTSTSSSTSTSETASTTSETSTNETASSTSTVTEEKETLEQVTSEAEILVQIASNQTGISQELENAIATSITDIAAAKALLGNEAVTVAEIQAAVSSLQASNQALGFLLLKDDEDGMITFALDTSTSVTLKVGDGQGVLIDTITTATPFMDDANGAKVSEQTFSSPYSGTRVAGWHTFSVYSTDTYDQNHKSSGGTALNAYIRYSLDDDPSTYTVLAELVSKTGTVLESYKIDPGSSATFSYPSQLDSDNSPITITYDTSLATGSGIPGGLRFSTDANKIYGTTLVPTYTTNTTYYKTTDGTVIASYSVMTVGGQTVTPSGVRSFVGYDYSSTTNATSNRALTPGTTYLHGKVQEQGTKTLITIVDDEGTIKRSLYYLDPTYKGTVDWNGTDMNGFIKLFETSEIAASTSTSGTNYNTYSTIEASYTTTTFNGQRIMVFYTSPAKNWRLIGYWSGGTAQGGTQYGQFYFGRQSLDKTGKWGRWTQSSSSTGVGDYGSQYLLGNPLSTSVNETTHWYTVDKSESESLSNSNSISLSESESTSTSESISNSKSASESESTSKSESASLSASESLSESISTSIKESVSESISESVRESVVESVSESLSESI
ncbi:TPA: KxYKxGKxW signal peptide domain-containing protein, partial [Streptococcus suis]